MVIFTNIINLYDNILINKYRGLITCNRLTPLLTPLSEQTSFEQLWLPAENLAISRQAKFGAMGKTVATTFYRLETIPDKLLADCRSGSLSLSKISKMTTLSIFLSCAL